MTVSVREGSLAPEVYSEKERKEIRDQLERMLDTHHFKNSRRYPALLRFIVEETLEGRGEYLKERLLGVQVFDRPADYDTASDPVVRVTIAEIRKRIAQYYHEQVHDSELRIDLQPGHYAPEFRWRTGPRSPQVTHVLQPVPQSAAQSVPQPAESAELPPQQPAPSPQVELQPLPTARAGWKKKFAIASAVCLLLTCALIGGWNWLHPLAVDELWAPVLNSRAPVLFCIPTVAGVSRFPLQSSELAGTPDGSQGAVATPTGPSFRDFENLGQNVVYSDMLAILSMTNILAAHHRQYHAKLNVVTTLEDLRQGPTILVGGLDNQWTLRAMVNLPYTFAGDGHDRYWIRDASHPETRQWNLDLTQQFASVTRDYAIVARLHNQQTAEPEMIVAGIGMSGTAAAGELIGEEASVQELKKKIGPHFRDRDFEVVIRTDVVNGVAGAPQIIAVALL